jgi:hypothetical protein
MLFKCLSIGSTRTRQNGYTGGAQNSVKEGTHLGPLIKGERVRETRATHPALIHRLPYLILLVRCEC